MQEVNYQTHPQSRYYDRRVARLDDETIVVFYAKPTTKNTLEITITPVKSEKENSIYESLMPRLKSKYVYIIINERERILIDVSKKTQIVYNETLTFAVI